MKKKSFVSSKDKKDWSEFTENIGELISKDDHLDQKNIGISEVPKLDLHGFTLDKANEKTYEFIINSYQKGYKKILIVTGKGSRSKSYENPYVSDKLSKLQFSVPEFVKNEENLFSKIKKIENAEKKHGGDGAIYIFLKNNSAI